MLYIRGSSRWNYYKAIVIYLTRSAAYTYMFPQSRHIYILCEKKRETNFGFNFFYVFYLSKFCYPTYYS
jgi:hypothetical protein